MDEFDAVRSTLQIASNEDVPDTSFTLAPNAYWPILFALGYDCPLPDKTELLELPRGVRSGLDVVSVADTVRHCLEYSSNPSENDHAELVLVDAHFTIRRPEPLGTARRYVRSVFGVEPDAVIVAGAVGGNAHVWLDPAEVQRESVVVSAGATAARFGEVTARAILIAADRHPHALIAVSAMNLKIASVLAGRYLSLALQSKAPRPAKNETEEQTARREKEMRLREHWHDVFGRLVLLHTSPISGDEFTAQAMRVRSTQPHFPELNVAPPFSVTAPHLVQRLRSQSVGPASHT
ncbi:hypothetical protein ACIGKQ_22290 [Gordonia sp. NPDC062954]|uniref:hypothetical protein n=1 Tax=Gordonia sp. NPDC062954 TaxID=3364003 RepID=UPI0037C62274